MANESSGQDLLLEVLTPLGFRMRITRAYLELIITVKHPIMTGREADVQETLAHPEEIRQSRSDPNVYLFYKTAHRPVCMRGLEATRRGRFPNHRLPDRCCQRRSADMAQVKVFYDQAGNTLTVWFGNPQDDYVSEETGEEVILMKDKAGHVIGFEKLNFSVTKPEPLRVAFETVAA